MFSSVRPMVDRLSHARRSWNMSRIRSGDTKPEKVLRSLLHSMGYRYRLHRAELPGKPDIVLPKYKTVIFVNGCFWHRHAGCKNAAIPKTNTEFWISKLTHNVERDRQKKAALEILGWQVITVWECETETSSEELAARLQELISAPDTETAYDDLLIAAERQEKYGVTESQQKTGPKRSKRADD